MRRIRIIGVCALSLLLLGTGAVGPADALATDACVVESQAVGDTTVWQFKTIGACQWTPPADLDYAEVLIVGGGGGGGGIAAAGGGGAGGVLYGAKIAIPKGPITVGVGGGGAGGEYPFGESSRCRRH
jgi:hypothetical protein